MSEEPGQKREDGIDFDSANIGKKKKAVQFTEIEGAEERAKAAEKAKIAAEKEAEELHQAEVEAASARQAKAEDRARLEKGGLLYRLFGGYRKWITLAIFLLIAAGIVGFIWWKNRKVELSPREAAKALYDEQIARVNDNDFENTYPPARDAMEQAWLEATGDGKFWYAYYYALMLRDTGLDEGKALSVVRGMVIPDNLNDEEKCLVVDLELKFIVHEDIDFGINSEDFERCLEEKE